MSEWPDEVEDLEFEFRRDWATAIATEETRRATLLAFAAGPDDAKRIAAREWWATAEVVLRMFSRAMAYDSRRGWAEPPPVQLLWALHGIAGHLAVGSLAGPVEAAMGRGAPGAGPREREDIAWATAYLALVTLGQINDTHPVKTVADSYGVAPSTVRAWGKKVLSPEMAAYLETPTYVERRMRDAGATYSSIGRSSAAIEKRQTKRKGAAK